MTALTVKGLSIAFGGVKSIDDVSLDAPAGVVTSIIGPNGAGKTTLFNLISGIYRPLSGSVHIGDNDVTGLATHERARLGMARTFQNLKLFPHMTVLDNVMTGCHIREKSSLVADLMALPQSRRASRESREIAMTELVRVGLDSEADRQASDLSYGQLKRLEIARALASGCSILLLDEPAAGCNAIETREIDVLIVRLAEEGRAVVLIEHDMRMVMRISKHIIVLDSGRKLVEGDADTVRHHPDVIAAYLGAHGAREAGAAHD